MWIYKELENRFCSFLHFLFLTAVIFADFCIFSVPPPSLGIVSVPYNWRNMRWLSATYICRFYILRRKVDSAWENRIRLTVITRYYSIWLNRLFSSNSTLVISSALIVDDIFFAHFCTLFVRLVKSQRWHMLTQCLRLAHVGHHWIAKRCPRVAHIGHIWTHLDRLGQSWTENRNNNIQNRTYGNS